MSCDSAELPPFLRPFVLPHDPVETEPVGDLDLYLPGETSAPAVLMVHGGPLRPDLPARPRDWPAFRGYGALLAQAGVVGAMFEHGFVGDDSLGAARDNIREAARSLRDNIREAARSLRGDPRVDPERLGIWCFSAGGLFMGSLLADAPGWGVAAVAGTYAVVGDPELDGSGWPQATRTAELSAIPLLLVRPEHDHDWIFSANDELLERCDRAGREVDVIEVPGAHHSFENVDDTDASRDAIRRSIDWWTKTLAA